MEQAEKLMENDQNLLEHLETIKDQEQRIERYQKEIANLKQENQDVCDTI